MKPAPFAYHAPRTIDAAIGLLAELASEEGRVLAGGQSLVPAMAMRLARPGHLIDINRVAGLSAIEPRGDAVAISACVRHSALHDGAVPGPLGRLLGMVQRHIAHPPIRARGTFCGSLAHADAASEWCLLAVALDALIEARSTDGTRMMAADDFFQGYMTTALAPEEMIVAAHLPLLPPHACAGFFEYARRAGDFAQVAAVAVYVPDAGIARSPRIALGGLESRPRRCVAAERAIDGRKPDDAVFRAAARAAAEALGPTEDPEYAAGLAETAVLRALQAAA